MDYKTSMTEGSIWKKMLLFCIPLIFGNIFQYLYSTVDSIIVGRLVGETALAAVGVCDPVISLVIGLCAGASGGAGVVISQYYGAKNETELKKAVHTTISIGVILGIIIQVATVLLTPLVLKWINTPEDVVQQATIYLRTYFSGMVFTLVFNMAAGILNAVGNSKMNMIYLSIASVMNIILDLVFVIVFRWGIFGAAFATLISQAFTCACAITFLVRCDDPMYRLDLKLLRADKGVSLKIFSLGIPTAMQNMVRCFANIVVQAGINGFGSLAVAGYAAYLRVDNILWLPLMSLGMAASTFTGQNIGAGQFDRAKKGAWVSGAASAVFTIAFSILIIILRYPLIGIFNDNPEVIHYGVLTLWGYIPLYWVFSVYNTLCGTINGAGKTFVSMVISIATMCAMRIVMLWIATSMEFGFLEFMCIVFPATWIVAMAAVMIYMWKADWMGIRNNRI